MSRYRALALRATVVALMATAGAATLTPTAASATPVTPDGTATARSHYPPTTPDLTVNKGTVKAGQSVKANGNKFAVKEKVTITVSFRAKGSNNLKELKTLTVYADKKGRFSLIVRTAKPGAVLIKSKGKVSHKSAYATVYVTAAKTNGGWVIKPAANSTSLTGGLASATDTGSAGVAIAGLGAMALIGSTVVTRRVVRRRRAGVAA